MKILSWLKIVPNDIRVGGHECSQIDTTFAGDERASVTRYHVVCGLGERDGGGKSKEEESSQRRRHFRGDMLMWCHSCDQKREHALRWYHLVHC